MNFKIEKRIKGKLGRAGVIETAHGLIHTPAFSPVGTKASVKSLTPEQIRELGAEVILANTYHLFLQPGDELIRDAGGLHRFMNWNGPIITDSGGFQVFSLGVAYGKELGKVVRITDPSLMIPERFDDSDAPKLANIGRDGVSFKSHLDGSVHYITPEKSIQIQHNLGADIIFAFDECTSPSEDFKYQNEALSRTHAWAERSLKEHERLEEVAKHSLHFPRLPQRDDTEEYKKLLGGNSELPERGVSQADGPRVSAGPAGPDSDPAREGCGFSPRNLPALFGIVQGGRDEQLRKKSAEFIGSLDFDGFGIGGSFAKEDMSSAVKWVNEILPEDKPRHLLGIGEPEDLLVGIENGVDLFDCVVPTRNARNGTIYTAQGKINITNTKYRNDFNPIEKECGCYTCQNFSRAYVAHLFRGKEMLTATLATIHNLYYISHLMKDARQAILEDRFFEFKEEVTKAFRPK